MRFRLCQLPLLLRLSILSSLAILLAACATSPGTLAVDLSGLKECRKLDPAVPGPGASIGRSSDYRDLSPQALAALRKKNEGSERRNGCEDRFIDRYRTAQ